jgi:hypothetical protein
MAPDLTMAGPSDGSGNGGGAYIDSAVDVTLEGVSFVENTGYAGGGVWIDGGNLVDVEGTFTGNEARLVGGAVFLNSNSTLLMAGDYVSNRTVDPAGLGGVLYGNDGFAVLCDDGALMLDMNTARESALWWNGPAYLNNIEGEGNFSFDGSKGSVLHSLAASQPVCIQPTGSGFTGGGINPYVTYGTIGHSDSTASIYCSGGLCDDLACNTSAKPTVCD